MLLTWTMQICRHSLAEIILCPVAMAVDVVEGKDPILVERVFEAGNGFLNLILNGMNFIPKQPRNLVFEVVWV